MSTSDFDTFWAAFLRPEKKQAARDAFAWAMKRHNGDGTLLARILATLEWQRIAQPERRYWQTPDKWLLGMRWEDDAPATVKARAVASRPKPAWYDEAMTQAEAREKAKA